MTHAIKQHLPNYGVFDEKRYFDSGSNATVTEIRDIPVAITLCEDLWEEAPARQARDAGVQLLININASPFHTSKLAQRHNVVTQRARENQLDIVYVNLVGGQDELVFDGGSMIADYKGDTVFQADEFQEDLYYVDYDFSQRLFKSQQDSATPLSRIENIYSALVLGIRDYVNKNGFRGGVIGLSGGIDSALTLCLAVDALGHDQVRCALMPSPYTADMSVADAEQQCRNLAVDFDVISIEKLFSEFRSIMEPVLGDTRTGTTEENIQARCRGTLLMAISNSSGRMVLATGNKSEMAVGYATLYGDMAGGFAPSRMSLKPWSMNWRAGLIVTGRSFRHESSSDHPVLNSNRTRKTRTPCHLTRYWIPSWNVTSSRIKVRNRSSPLVMSMTWSWPSRKWSITMNTSAVRQHREFVSVSVPSDATAVIQSHQATGKSKKSSCP